MEGRERVKGAATWLFELVNVSNGTVYARSPWRRQRSTSQPASRWPCTATRLGTWNGGSLQSTRQVRRRSSTASRPLCDGRAAAGGLPTNSRHELGIPGQADCLAVLTRWAGKALRRPEFGSSPRRAWQQTPHRSPRATSRHGRLGHLRVEIELAGVGHAPRLPIRGGVPRFRIMAVQLLRFDGYRGSRGPELAVV